MHQKTFSAYRVRPSLTGFGGGLSLHCDDDDDKCGDDDDDESCDNNDECCNDDDRKCDGDDDRGNNYGCDGDGSDETTHVVDT